MQTKFLQMKRGLHATLLVLLLSVVGMAKGYAQDFTVDGLKYTVNEDGVSVTLTGYMDDMWCVELDIPDFVVHSGSRYPVTVIGDYAFAESSGAFYGALTIPNSVTTIGEYAFYYSEFNSLTLGNSVQIIGDNAFDMCFFLSGDLIIPSSVTSIGDGALCSCGRMDRITVETGNSYYDSRDNCNAIVETATNKLIAGCKNSFIPNTITAIGPSALGNCSLASIVIPSSVTSIGDFAFAWNDLTSIVIPNNVVSIGKGAFEEYSIESIIVEDGNPVYDSRDNCNAIIETSSNTLVIGGNNTVIPNTVTAIEDYAFFCRHYLTGDLVIPNSVKTIGESAFFQCCGGYEGGDAVLLTIGNSVETIGTEAFSGGRFTGDLALPNSVTTIGNGAFSYCGFTGNLVVPNSVATIGEYAFNGCPFTHISVGSGNARYDSRGNCNAIIEKSTNALIRGCNNTVIPNSVTTIGDYSFNCCTGFTGNLVIPNSVTAIGYGAFSNCYGSNVSLTIGNSVTTIGSDAFSWFEGLDAITCLAETPPDLISEYDWGEDWWYEVSCTTLTVSCGYASAYEASDWHDHFTTILEECSRYAISIEDTTGGTVSASVYSAILGEEVQLIVMPNEGMMLSLLTVCNANNPSQTISVYSINKSSSTFGFLMPSYDLTVKAAFVVGNAVGEGNGIAMSVCPNPTNGLTRIEAEAIRHVTISNTLGQVIYESKAEGNEFTYDFGKHGGGFYFIRIETENGVSVKKVSVTR